MPGDSHVPLNSPDIVGLFHRALGHQLIWVLVLAGLIAAVVVVVVGLRRVGELGEPRSRTFLRWAFGTIWVVDGLLQLQPSMPVGLGNQVVAPTAEGTPDWLHHLVLSAVGAWNRHPIALDAASGWIEIGIGLVLLGSVGRASRVAAGVSVAWGAVIWVVANSMGGIFSTSATFLFGWPGAVAIYVVAGVWLAGPRRWFPEDFSRVTLRLLAALLVVASAVQAWPDHGFWRGGPSNPLRQMTLDMSHAAQPGWLASVVAKSGEIGSAMGGGFNLMVLFWLVASAVGLWRASTRREWWGLVLFSAGCAWIFVVAQDVAVFGGLSTDVNSMVPLVALAWCASPILRSAAPLRPLFPDATRRGVRIALSSIGAAMIVVAVVPMARSPFADAETTLYLATQNGASMIRSDLAAPRFTLADQRERPYAFPAPGRYSVVTFLDPKCWTDCPLLAAQLEALSTSLTPTQASKVDFVAVAANPDHESVADLHGFMASHGLDTLPHFHFLTGPLPRVRAVWRAFGVDVSIEPGEVMSVHSDVVEFVGPDGVIRVIVPDDPPEGSDGTASSVIELRAALRAAGLS
jgi:cytochrome oxidase Cu insertion factor (SCO1/SenC/PrrC family)